MVDWNWEWCVMIWTALLVSFGVYNGAGALAEANLMDVRGTVEWLRKELKSNNSVVVNRKGRTL